MSLNVKLVVVGGDVKTTEVDLRLPSIVGRGRGLGIVLPHPLVSRQHCELFESDGRLMVRDLGSLNGTFVNNERVTESPLEPGELLTVGTVTFRAVYEANGAGSAAKTPTAAPSDKTVQVMKATTMAVGPKPAAKKPPPQDSGDEEFDFGGALLPGDEDVVPTETPGAGPKTEPMKVSPAPQPAASDDSGDLDDAEDDDLDDFLDSLEKK